MDKIILIGVIGFGIVALSFGTLSDMFESSDKKVDEKSIAQDAEVGGSIFNDEGVGEEQSDPTVYNPLSVEQEIEKAKSKLSDGQTLFVFLNQFGNPFNLALSNCSSDYLCYPTIYDALGEKVDGAFKFVSWTGEYGTLAGSDNDGYLLSFSETLPKGEYTLKLKLKHDGQIGPTKYFHHFNNRGYPGLDTEGVFVSSIARYYKTPMEQNFSIAGDGGVNVVTITGEQTSISYPQTTVCAEFKNALGTKLDMSVFDLNAETTLRADGDKIGVYAGRGERVDMEWERKIDLTEQAYIKFSDSKIYGYCASMRTDDPKDMYDSGEQIDYLLPGKYEWVVKREGYKEAVIPFELPDVSDWSDDEVRAKGVTFINVGEITLEKE